MTETTRREFLAKTAAAAAAAVAAIPLIPSGVKQPSTEPKQPELYLFADPKFIGESWIIGDDGQVYKVRGKNVHFI